jgi:uncharacterized membrane protein
MPRASAPSPLRDGFAALRHEPALLAAELTWRWCFGVSMLALAIFSTGTFLDSIPVSRLDELLLGTFQPQLLVAALRHIFRGTLSRFLLEQALLIMGVTLLWSFASAVGRAATLRRLVAMFGSDDESQPSGWHFGSIFLLQLLRAMWTQIAFGIAVFLLIYGSTMAELERPVVAALALSFGVGFASFVGFSLNWYLGIAALFTIRNGARAKEAAEQAIEFSTRQGTRLLLLSLGFLLMRLIWAAVMVSLFLAPLSLMGTVGGRWVALMMGLLALLYFVGADTLSLALWGAYVSLAEDDSHPALEPEMPPLAPAPMDIMPLEGLA